MTFPDDSVWRLNSTIEILDIKVEKLDATIEALDAKVVILTKAVELQTKATIELLYLLERLTGGLAGDHDPAEILKALAPLKEAPPSFTVIHAPEAEEED
jgi:hypothetical protein